MSVPSLDLAAQHRGLLPELCAAFETAAGNAAFVLGPSVEQFEKAFADYCDVGTAVGMSSGTDALLAALMALKINAGDEVITSPFTFFATAGSIARTGAKPVFVDIKADTFNIDPAAIEAAITPRTRAIMPVHLYGQLADMSTISAIAKKHDLFVIEDAAQAVGATRDGLRAGGAGDIAAFSFYPTKNLAALGDGGACTTDSAELAATLKQIRLHGMSGGYIHETIGGNFRLDAIQAEFLKIKLQRLDQWTAARRAIASSYGQAFADSPVVTPHVAADATHVYHQYTIRVPDGRRDALLEHFNAAGVGSRVYYPLPLHLQPCFADLGYAKGALAESEAAATEVISLPIYPEMTEAQVTMVTDTLVGFFK